eukprot:62626-Rhodomonas_salina.2
MAAQRGYWPSGSQGRMAGIMAVQRGRVCEQRVPDLGRVQEGTAGHDPPLPSYAIATACPVLSYGPSGTELRPIRMPYTMLCPVLRYAMLLRYSTFRVYPMQYPVLTYSMLLPGGTTGSNTAAILLRRRCAVCGTNVAYGVESCLSAYGASTHCAVLTYRPSPVLRHKLDIGYQVSIWLQTQCGTNRAYTHGIYLRPQRARTVRVVLTQRTTYCLPTNACGIDLQGIATTGPLAVYPGVQDVSVARQVRHRAEGTVMFLNKPPPVGSVLYHTDGGLVSEHHGMYRNLVIPNTELYTILNSEP